MKNSLLVSIVFITLLSSFSGCDKSVGPNCNEMKLNETFNAQINQIWCLEGDDLSIRFGPVIEDSRCNVPNITCIWAGRFVMGATIDGGIVRDTFVAETNWSDTLYHESYKIILLKVYPEIRTSMEPLDSTKYSFDIVVKQ